MVVKCGEDVTLDEAMALRVAGHYIAEVPRESVFLIRAKLSVDRSFS